MVKNIYQQAVEQLPTIIDWVRFASSEFERQGVYYGHGTDNPWDEALLLVTASLQMPFEISPQQAQCRLIHDERTHLAQLIQRRIEERIPVAYIINEAWFCGLPFYVDERVLVPRSPLAEIIQNRVSPWLDGKEPNRVLDLCCGSGCIGISSLQAFPEAQLDLADLSRDALDVAEINIERHQLFDQVAAIESDLFSNLQPGYDLILSNPPYVDAEDLADMPAEYQHEPAMGLGSGHDGLDITRQILANACDYLNPEGVLVVEVGNSWIHLEAEFPQVPFTWVEFEHGGDGVFVFTREQLAAHQHHFRV
ncbi:MAG: 50S ribosomal protein L3 N(5)-glutamine methyltransferase [Bermanella sp.]